MTNQTQNGVLTPSSRLTGTVDGTGSSVATLAYHFDNLEDVPVSFSPTGAFDQEFDFSQIDSGHHTLTITTTDVAGNTASANFDTSVIKDTTPPVITAGLADDIAAHGGTNSDGITSDPTITGTVTDDSAFASFQAGFDNTPITNFTNILPLRHSDGSFTLDRTTLAQIFGDPITDGTHTLHLEAADAYGNIANIYNVNFTLDTTAPSLTLDNPIAGGVYSNTAHLIGTVSDSGPGAASVTYSLEGQASSWLTPDPQGHFDQAFSTPGLANGNHHAVITAFDAAGNNTTQTVDFQVDPNFVFGPNSSSGWGMTAGDTVTLTAGNSFVVQAEKPIALGQTSGSRTLQFDLNSQSNSTDTNATTADRFLLYLVDPAHPTQTLLDDGQPGTALFDLAAGGQADFIPGLVHYNNSHVEVDLTSLGTQTNCLNRSLTPQKSLSGAGASATQAHTV